MVLNPIYIALVICEYRLNWLILILLGPYMSSCVYLIFIFHSLQYYVHWLLYNICKIHTWKYIHSLINSWGNLKGWIAEKVYCLLWAHHTFWGGKGRDKNMSINAEAVEMFFKAKKGSQNKLLKGLVKRHAAECSYSKHPYHSLREDVEIKLLLKCLKRSRADCNKK